MRDVRYETLAVNLNRPALTITLNRPERLNAFNPTLHRELAHAIGETSIFRLSAAVGADGRKAYYTQQSRSAAFAANIRHLAYRRDAYHNSLEGIWESQVGLLEGKVVLVTGAGRGVGRCIALDAAKEGAKIVVNDLGGDETGKGGEIGPAEAVVREIQAMGGEAVADGHSVADWDAAHRIIERALDTFGRLDGVVNNAGILRDKIFHKMERDEFEGVVKVHLFGSFYVSRAAAAVFRERGGGAFVHMTSTSGLIGNFGQANYMAAKLGVVGLSKSIAMDMQRFNVRSNAIAPFAWTRLVGTIPETTPEEKKRVEGLKKLRPELISPFAVALLSDGAAGVTGQVFGTRANEIFLFSQARPIRTAHTGDGWSPRTVVERVLPAFAGSFYPLERSGDVFTWDPV